MNDSDNTKTIYFVIINRFSNVTKDIATAVSSFDNQEQAEQYAKEVLEEKDYMTLRFAVTILPLTIITPQAKVMHTSHPYGYTETKMATNLAGIDPLSPTTQN